MGATLPAVARWVQTTPTGVSWLGFFYAGNIAGAVMGTLLAGFYLLRVFDMNTATYVAAGHQLRRRRSRPARRCESSGDRESSMPRLCESRAREAASG